MSENKPPMAGLPVANPERTKAEERAEQNAAVRAETQHWSPEGHTEKTAGLWDENSRDRQYERDLGGVPTPSKEETREAATQRWAAEGATVYTNNGIVDANGRHDSTAILAARLADDREPRAVKVTPTVDGTTGETRYTEREEVLNGAKDAVMNARNNTYGPPTQDFDRTAVMMSAMGFEFNGSPIESHHVAMVMAAVKLSRLSWTPDHKDSWTDLAGYAACGYECAVAEGKAQG